MNAHPDSTCAAPDNGLGAPAPFAETAVDRFTVLGSSEAAAAATIWIDTTVSII